MIKYSCVRCGTSLERRGKYCPPCRDDKNRERCRERDAKRRATERAALVAVAAVVALILASCVARAPDGSTQWDVGTTVKALSCANADLSRADERRRCHVESGR